MRVQMCACVYIIGLHVCVHVYVHSRGRETERPIGCLKLQVIFRKRATNNRALLRRMTCEDKAPYDSTPPCSSNTRKKAGESAQESEIEQSVQESWRDRTRKREKTRENARDRARKREKTREKARESALESKRERAREGEELQRTAAHCNTLQHTATHCNTRNSLYI